MSPGPATTEQAHPGIRSGSRPRATNPTRLVLTRHGQTDHNRDGRLQGQVDIPLNDVGLRQAARLARALAQDPPDVVVCSPLERARDTALIVGRACRREVIVQDDFLERGFGQWEGLTGEEIRTRWPEEHAAWREHRPVTGLDVEDRPEVGDRVALACRRLVEQHPGRTVLVVGHGAATTLGITTLLGLDPHAFRGVGGLENCHRSTLEPLLAGGDEHLMRLLSHNVAPDVVPSPRSV